MKYLRRARLYAPGVGLLLAMVMVQAALAAPPNPTAVTAQGCSFSDVWGNGLSLWLFGISGTLMVLAVIMGGLQVRAGNSGGGTGGEHVTGAIGGLTGIALILGLIGAVPLLAAFARSAAGGVACP